jgi:L-fuconolactonase
MIIFGGTEFERNTTMHIDSEVHFWKYNRSNSNPLIRNNKLLAQHYLPEQLAQSLHRNGIQGCVAVTAENLEVESRFLAELAYTHPEILGVVGWTDLHDPHAEDKIKKLKEYTPLKGFQYIPVTGQEPSDAVMELLQAHQYSLDLSLVTNTSLPSLTQWIKNFPEQSFILRNCGNPDTSQIPTTAWERQIRELSGNNNLFCKVSGLLSTAKGKSWKPADFYPFLDIIFNAFGPERLLYASDWPFLLLTGIYVQWKSLLEKYMEKFPEEDRALFFGENAMHIYRL